MKGEKRGNVTKGYQKLCGFRYVSCLAVTVKFESQDDPLVRCIFGSKGLSLYAHIFFVRIPDKSSIEKKNPKIGRAMTLVFSFILFVSGLPHCFCDLEKTG